MDVTTLFTGAAGAAAPPAAGRPGPVATGGAAPPAGDAPSAAEAGFGALVALALDRLEAAGAPADSTSVCHAAEAEADAAPAGATAGATASPLDGAADAATLSVLIALAAAQPAPVAPDTAGGPAAPGDAIAADLTLGDRPVGVIAEPAAAVAARATLPAGASVQAPAFDEALATASSTGIPAGPASATAPAATTTPTAPASAATTVAAPPVPEGDLAGTPSAAPDATGESSRAASRGPRPALRDALAVMAAPTPSTTGADVQAPAVAPAATPSGDAPSPGTVVAIARSDTPGDAAPAPVRSAPRAAIAAAIATPVAVPFEAAADDGSTGEQGRGERPPAAALAAVPVVGAGPVASAWTPDAGSLAPGPVSAPAQALPIATDVAALRAIEPPAAARLEQAIASLDPDTRNLQAMVRTVRLFASADGASEARLRLEPEHLGPVALTVRVEQGSVSAHFRAETPAAQRWIETHQQELRSNLREQGLDVREVVVTTDPDGRRERRHEAPARPRPRRLAAGADVPRFEVLV